MSAIHPNGLRSAVTLITGFVAEVAAHPMSSVAVCVVSLAARYRLGRILTLEQGGS